MDTERATKEFLEQCSRILSDQKDCANVVVKPGTFNALLSMARCLPPTEKLKASAEEDVERMEALAELMERGCYVRKFGSQYELINHIGTRMHVSSTLRGVLNNYIMATRHNPASK